MSYDLGFRKYGSPYEIVADWFGVRGINQKEFTQRLTQRYAYHATRGKLEKQGFDMVEEKVEETGQIRIVSAPHGLRPERERTWNCKKLKS